MKKYPLSQNSLPLKPVLVSAVGFFLEFYEFMVYGFLAPVISPLFFPTQNPFISTVLGFSIFAISFLVKPIGGFLFGHIGDKVGRKKALSFTLLGMGLGGLIIGLSPTYASIGIAAPILVIVARLMQGISLGGEVAGANIFAAEHSAQNRRGLAMGILAVGSFGGGMVSFLTCSLCTSSIMPTWGWRIPFLVSFLVALTGWYIRTQLMETPEFCSIKKNQFEKWPLLKAIQFYPSRIFSMAIICGCIYAHLYMVTVYVPSFLKNIPSFSVSNTFINLCGMFSFLGAILAAPVFGAIADRVNKIYATIFGLLISLSSTFLLLHSLPFLSPFYIALSLFLLGIVMVIPLVSWNPMGVEVFYRKETRYSAFALSSNLGDAILGGTAPLTAAFLVGFFNHSLIGIDIYLLTLGFLSISALLYLSAKTLSGRVIVKEQAAGAVG